ncbi:hypothetical protein M9Y10_023420 [Tritrichomonas musculus]|uniref:Uncharacterized protein n=1 Tax=Tritrichomonas musculus TaxID=1915356 RepID=A0ABR2KVV1_9EUKA
MKAGYKSINIRDFTITDDEESRAPKSMEIGWFYIRVVDDITQEELSKLGVTFYPADMIQKGWFKKFLNKDQVDRIRRLNKFALFPVKNYQKPDFIKLNQNSQLRVVATDDWMPDPPVEFRKEANGIYTVTGQTAEKLFEDPRVCAVGEVSIAMPI